MVPLGETLTDQRCQLTQVQFFALSQGVENSFDPKTRKKNTMPSFWISITRHQRIASDERPVLRGGRIERLARHLKPDGVFALWTENRSPVADQLSRVFGWAEGHTIEFDNPITEDSSKGAVWCKNSR